MCYCNFKNFVKVSAMEFWKHNYEITNEDIKNHLQNQKIGVIIYIEHVYGNMLL